ncbi:MAG TPA: glutamate 5-kinase [Bacillota bacterium]|nr:glutamate 5-kinase [Bacillota bacterium]
MFSFDKKKLRVVVKIGSSSLTEEEGGIAHTKLNDHVDALASLINQGHEVILISSGAVAAGFTALGFHSRPTTIEMKQASAAVGQGQLIHTYSQSFARYNIPVAQILLTRRDFSSRKMYINAHNTMSALLGRGAIPIINENDTVSVDELTFGDNDMLSALVAGFLHADLLIILTDTDGLYNANPKTDPNAQKLDYVPRVTKEIEEMAGGAGSKVGTGGMRSKVIAAQTALSFGVRVFVGFGQGEDKLIRIIQGEGAGTYFGSDHLSNMKSKKQWIAFHADVMGSIVVDQGAKTALLELGKSLLPSGITDVHGTFSEGDVIEVITSEGEKIGKGLINYSSQAIEKVKGNSSEVAMAIAKASKPEVIHRDEWVSYEWREL